MHGSSRWKGTKRSRASYVLSLAKAVKGLNVTPVNRITSARPTMNIYTDLSNSSHTWSSVRIPTAYIINIIFTFIPNGNFICGENVHF